MSQVYKTPLKQKLRSLLRRMFPQAAYVIVYDRLDNGEEFEEYYGYFSSVEEAKRMWKSYVDLGSEEDQAAILNVKLCRIVEDSS